MPLKKLSYHKQIYRLRCLALAALSNYDLAVAQISLINHGENTCFKVIARNKKKNQVNKFVLRIHRSGYHNEQAIRVELQWLLSISKETNLIVPVPVAGKDGEILYPIFTDEVRETRSCVLFGWIEGQFYDKRLTASSMFKVGKLSAQLQSNGKSFPSSDKSLRPKWNAEGLIGKEAIMGAIPDVLEKKDKQIVKRAKEKIVNDTHSIENDPKRFGLIHADLHPGNYMFHKGEIRAIDFDDCGLGYYMYDLAVTIDALTGLPDFEKLSESTIEGYNSICAIKEKDLALIETLKMARRLCMLGWVFSHSDIPRVYESIPRTVKKMTTFCKEYLL